MTDTMMASTPTANGPAPAHLDPNRRQDVVLLFDVTDGNPNGDPDADNMPRVDPETMQGLVTDVAIKRKIRDWVDATRGTQERFNIYVQNRGIALNTLHQEAYNAENIPLRVGKQAREEVDRAQAWMCKNFYDVRTFGAVMSTNVNAGQVRGPVQFTFARSIDPIVPLDVSITRVAITRVEDTRTVVAEGPEEGGKRTEMGRKAMVPYGLYRSHCFVVPPFATRTRFDGEDLAVLWEALQRMWDLDRSAARGLMACRGLYVFSHSSPLGNAPAHNLFARVQVQRRPGVAAPRLFEHYDVTVDEDDLPDGVSLTRLVG